MATTAATRRAAPRPRSDQEARPDAIHRLLQDRVRQGLTRRVSDPVVVARLAVALKNGDGNGHSRVSHLTKRQRQQLAGAAKGVGITED